MSRKTMLLCGFVLLKLIMHIFLVNPDYDLHRDEFLHLDQAHHLAWGYESVPPFTSWISYIIWQLGNSVFWIKFFPALFGALTIVIVWKTTETLGGNLFSLVLSAIAVSLSVLPRINILYQPNSFDILAWTFLYYALICYFRKEENKWLYIAAFAFALGFLNKYNIAFLLMGMVPALLITNSRKVFLNKHLYFAVLVALILITPNLLWQYNNKFPVIHHMKELAETQLVNVERSDFIKEQVIFFFGSLFITIAALISFFMNADFKKFRFVFWTFIFTIALFIYFKAKGYYAIGLYPILLAFGAVYLEKLTTNSWKNFLRPVMLILPVIIFIPFISKIFPVHGPETFAKSGKLNRWEDGKDYPMPQDFADMLGWRELAHKTDSIYKNCNDKAHMLVICDNYGQAGAINFYTKENIHAVSMNADYINWFNLDEKILHAISIKEKKNLELIIEKKIFDSITLLASIDNTYAREKGTTIFLLSSPKLDINQLLKKEIEKRKNYSDK